MTSKNVTPRPGEGPDPAMQEDLRAAYEAHTLAQMIYGRMAMNPVSYPSPMAAGPVWPSYWPNPYGGGWG